MSRKAVIPALLGLLSLSFSAIFIPPSTAVDSVIGGPCPVLNATQIQSDSVQVCAKKATGNVWVTVEINPSASRGSDGFPDKVPAPNRSCVGIGQTTYFGRIPLICQKESHRNIWRVDLTQEIPNVSNSDLFTLVPAGPVIVRKGKAPAPLVPGMVDINLTNSPTDLVSPVAVNARKQFLLQMKNAPKDLPNFQWIIDTGVDTTKLAQLKSDLNASARYWSVLLPINQPLRIYVAMSTDFQWIANNAYSDLDAQGVSGGWIEYKLSRAKIEGLRFYGGVSVGYSKDGTAVLMYYFGNQSYGDQFANHAYSHELVHVVQRYALGNMAPMECWVREGQAVYTGLNFATHNSTAAFRNGILQALNAIQGDPEISGFRNWNEAKFLQFFNNQNSKSVLNCDPMGNYLFGAMAWQYIYGTYGYNAVTQFFLDLKKMYDPSCTEPGFASSEVGAPCPSWKDAYTAAFGISPDLDFHNFARFVYSEIQWAKKQHVVNGDDALKIAPVAFKSPF